MMPNMPAKDRTLSKVGANVARLRAAKGFSQEKLAERAEIDRTYVSGIERGVRNPGIKTVLHIASALGVSVAELCEDVS